MDGGDDGRSGDDRRRAAFLLSFLPPFLPSLLPPFGGARMG
jgi:hypothetical protein